CRSVVPAPQPWLSRRVLGAVPEALTNVSVKNSEALLESPEELADLLPALIAVALPQLGGALPSIALPAIGPLELHVQPGGITSVQNNSFLAIFGDVALIANAATRSARDRARADTEAALVGVRAPASAAGLAG